MSMIAPINVRFILLILMSNKHYQEDSPENDRTIKRQKETPVSTSVDIELSIEQVKKKCVEFENQIEVRWNEFEAYLSQLPTTVFNQTFIGDDSEQTLLMYFIEINCSPGISFVLAQNGIDVNIIQPSSGFTALHMVCDKGEIDLVILEKLLENGANPNLFSNSNVTPLYLILVAEEFQFTHFQAVQLLTTKYKAELNAEPTCIDRAYVSGNCLSVLSDRKNFRGAFILQTVQFLIENGAIVNFKNTKSQRTPLMQCFIRNSSCLHVPEYIELLIRNHVDLDTQDGTGNTALHWACGRTFHSLSLIELLLTKGANPNLFNTYNETPLYMMLVKSDFKLDDLEALRLLVRNKVELNKESSNVNQAYVDGNCLHVLGKRTHFDSPHLLTAIQFVIDSGANVNFLNQTSTETPLMRACFQSSNDSAIQYVQLLIQNKANLDVTDVDDDTALDMLYRSNDNNPEIAKLLIRNGANCIETYRRYTFFPNYQMQMLAILIDEIFAQEPDETKRKQILFYNPKIDAAQTKLVQLLQYYATRTNQQNLIQSMVSANGSNALQALVLTYL